jgi:hypothetical protein
VQTDETSEQLREDEGCITTLRAPLTTARMLSEGRQAKKPIQIHEGRVARVMWWLEGLHDQSNGCGRQELLVHRIPPDKPRNEVGCEVRSYKRLMRELKGAVKHALVESGEWPNVRALGLDMGRGCISVLLRDSWQPAARARIEKALASAATALFSEVL